MSTRLVIPQIYAPLFLPNHTKEQAARFTAEYKAEIRRRLFSFFEFFMKFGYFFHIGIDKVRIG